MARTIHKLTAAQVKALQNPGRHSDGGGLYINVTKTGTKSWLFIWTNRGRRREMGLGPFPAVSMAHARDKAIGYRQDVANGNDPIQEQKKLAEPNFLGCFKEFLTAKEAGWKNYKHRQQWHMTLMCYGRPLHSIKVSQITTPDVLAVLKPIWVSKHETANRLRGRIEAVLDYAKAMGWRSGENPAVWRGNLKSLLPIPAHTRVVHHHPAMELKSIPQFIVDLQKRDALTARLLEFIILTACRSGEARAALWSEFDLENQVWTVPASRMKTNREHVVPLSRRVLEILNICSEFSDGDLVFPNLKNLKICSVNATRSLLHRMEWKSVTTHGFRSTFRDWAGDETNFQHETIESALSHVIKNKAEAAYRRSNALEKRRKLMQEWSDYCCSKVLATNRSECNSPSSTTQEQTELTRMVILK
ncbi:MAG: integrase [Robiginitomaculum sp.]|nr:MAG: integrase [Robiginitomaculum sp.]